MTPLWERCHNCNQVNDTEFSNFCSVCAGKAFMGQYAKTTEDTPSVKELLELSTLYHTLISDLADVWDLDINPTTRARAFQLVADMGEQVKMKTLAAMVITNLEKEN